MIPSIGRIVHYVIPSGDHRPAIIVHIFDPVPTEASLVQLQVFLDGTNDGIHCNSVDTSMSAAECLQGTAWRTSVHQDPSGAVGTWHQPEKVE